MDSTVDLEEELRYLGWNELDNGCRIVEWPDRAPGLLAAAERGLKVVGEVAEAYADLWFYSNPIFIEVE